MKFVLAVPLCFLLSMPCLAQEKPVPVGEEGHHHLVLENEYTRVFHVEVAPKKATLYHQHDRDYIWVQIGAADVRNRRVDGATSEMKMNGGEVKFIKGGFAHQVTNLTGSPFVNVTIEIKKPSTKAIYGADWPGAAPQKPALGGTRISMGLAGQTRDLKTDAVAANTYYVLGSGTGVTPHDAEYPRLLVALTPMKCNCEGAQSIDMKPGDVAWIPKGKLAAASILGESKPMFVMVSFN